MAQFEFSSGELNSDDSDEDSSFEREHMMDKIYEPIDNLKKIVISVIDTGIGIKKKDRLKLFKLFGCL